MSNNYGSIEVVRALSATEINKLTNPQLKIALATVLQNNAERNILPDGPSNADLMNELQNLKECLKEIPILKQENARLSKEITTLYEIAHNQQLHLESRDRLERQRNLIVRGVSEDSDDVGPDDPTKIRNILRASECPVDVSGLPVKRLGPPNDRRRRPILLILNTPQDRNDIVESGKRLKSGANANSPFSTIYLKKDIHPAIRKEHRRMYDRLNEEKLKPSNEGCNLEYDWKNRVLRDGVVIDRFFPKFF